MADIVFELIRAVVIGVILAYLWWAGQKENIHQQQGWGYILTGFSLLFFGMLVDITDNFPSLNKYVVIGDTEYEAFLEKVVGYLFGFILLAIGFWKWMPTIVALRTTQRQLKGHRDELETRVNERTAELKAITEQLGGEIGGRKQAEEVLRVNERKLSTTLAAAPIGIGLAKNRVLEWVNGQLLELLGYSEEDLLGKSARILYEDDKEFNRVGEFKYGQIRRTGTGEVDTRWQCKDGTVLDIHLRTTALNPGDLSEGDIFTAMDTTERKRVEEELLSEKRLSEEYVNSLPGLFYVFDEQRFVRWNREWNRITGYSDEELGSRYGTDFFEGKDRGLIGERMLKVFREGAAEAEAELVTKDGRRIPYYFTGLRKKLNGRDHLIGLGLDITERKKAEEALRESEKRFRAVFENAMDGILLADLTVKRFVDGNATICRMLGYEHKELLQLGVTDIHPKEDLSHVLAQFEKQRRGEITLAKDIPVLRKDGSVFFSDISSAPFNLSGSTYMVGLFRDITERKRAAELIEHQATFDALTDLPNRRLLLDRVAQALARCRRHDHLGAALFIDLDNFKNINDSLGHQVGDALLQEVARRLKKGLREEDTSARLGGDEFMVLFSEVSDDPEQAAQQARVGAEKILKVLSAPYAIHDYELHITASIGIAMFPMENESADDIVRHADTAMYRSKEAGRNAIRFFLPSMQLAAEERLKLQNDLRQAIGHDELHLHFQPQVDVSGNIIGAEALLRWQHPERGNVPPADFIPVAEDTGQILAIGEWVLESAMDQLKAWTDDISDSRFRNLAINVSPKQFRQADFIIQIERILGETGADPNLLTLELTEGILVDDLEDTIQKMVELERLGVRFSIDDFGTGYSSLAYLKRLLLNEIKIDRSFVRDITTDPGDANLVETIITMAEHLGLKVVAEGVETEAQLDFLREKGCRLFQGYYFSRPQPVEEFTEILSKRITYPKGSGRH